jgi:hypothetical protein
LRKRLQTLDQEANFRLDSDDMADSQVKNYTVSERLNDELASIEMYEHVKVRTKLNMRRAKHKHDVLSEVYQRIEKKA